MFREFLDILILNIIGITYYTFMVDSSSTESTNIFRSSTTGVSSSYLPPGNLMKYIFRSSFDGHMSSIYEDEGIHKKMYTEATFEKLDYNVSDDEMDVLHNVSRSQDPYVNAHQMGSQRIIFGEVINTLLSLSILSYNIPSKNEDVQTLDKLRALDFLIGKYSSQEYVSSLKTLYLEGLALHVNKVSSLSEDGRYWKHIFRNGLINRINVSPTVGYSLYSIKKKNFVLSV